MSEEINFEERYDRLLNIQPSYGVKRIKKPVKFNYVGVELELSVSYERDRYSFIRSMLKKIIKAVGNNGYFVKDGTILGDYAFEIILDPMSIKKVKKIYSTILKIVEFSDSSIVFDKEHNCGLHLNFNQYDIEDMDEAHKRLLLLMSQKEEYFEENIYKRVIYDFDFESYLEFQRDVADKYASINYLNKKLVEVRNIKVGLTPKSLEIIMTDIINALFFDKLKQVKLNKYETTYLKLLNSSFSKNNKAKLRESIESGYLILKLDKTPKVIVANDTIKQTIYEEEKNYE